MIFYSIWSTFLAFTFAACGPHSSTQCQVMVCITLLCIPVLGTTIKCMPIMHRPTLLLKHSHLRTPHVRHAKCGKGPWRRGFVGGTGGGTGGGAAAAGTSAGSRLARRLANPWGAGTAAGARWLAGASLSSNGVGAAGGTEACACRLFKRPERLLVNHAGMLEGLPYVVLIIDFASKDSEYSSSHSSKGEL